MDIKDAEKTIDTADSFLTKLKAFLKKHWGILTLLLIGYFFYWAFTTDFEETPKETAPTEINNYQPYIVDSYLEIDEYGDTVLIEVWDDGHETIGNYENEY